jgi:lipoic acid synthetase
MLGIGEEFDEIEQVLVDIRKAKVDILTLGQYLQPTKMHIPVDRYVDPKEFMYWKAFGLSIGFRHVESGPLVRSSYHAEELV